MAHPFVSPWGQTVDSPPLHIYVAADANRASDKNSGTNPSLPLKTINEAVRRINSLRIARSPVIVHLDKSQTPYQFTENIRIDIDAPLVFIGDGAGQGSGDGFKELLTGTIDAGATKLHLPVVGGGLVPDAFFGKTVELTSGTSSGWRRMINSNDAVSLDVCNAFNLDVPAQGNTFRVVEPEVQVSFPGATAGPTGTVSELFRIIGTGQTSGNVQRNVAFYTASTAMVYFVNLAMRSINGSSSSIILENSSLCLVGCESGDGASDNGPTLLSDERSIVSVGHDFFFGTSRLSMSLEAGFVSGDDPRVWAGWSSFWNALGFATILGCARFVGFIHSNDEIRFEGVQAVLVGGRVSSVQGSLVGIDMSEHSHVLLDGNSFSRPLSIENNTDEPSACAICVRGASILNAKDVSITKTNQGHGILAFADDSGQGALPGMASVGSSTTITGVVGATTPTNALRAAGGARINYRATPTIAGTWTAEAAVAANEVAAPAAGASGPLSSLTSDGDAYPTEVSGLSGVNGWIQRH